MVVVLLVAVDGSGECGERTAVEDWSSESLAWLQLSLSKLVASGTRFLRASMDIDIDGVLSIGNLPLKWSDVKEGIHSFPDIHAEEECMRLQNARLHSAVFREFHQPSDELSIFSAQLGSLTELQQQHPLDLHRHDFVEAPASESSGEYLQWLKTAELSIVEAMHQRSLRSAISLVQASEALLKLADDLDLLRPHNDSHLPQIIKVEQWRVYWHALIAEMSTVEEVCSEDIRNSGVFVLTTWPYKEFLRLLARRLGAEAFSGCQIRGVMVQVQNDVCFSVFDLYQTNLALIVQDIIDMLQSRASRGIKIKRSNRIQVLIISI